MVDLISGEWLRAVVFCLAAGLVWGAFKELSDSRRTAALSETEPRPFNIARAAKLGLGGWAACLAGLIILTWLGLTDLPSW
jgi:hypothetical protein